MRRSVDLSIIARNGQCALLKCHYSSYSICCALYMVKHKLPSQLFRPYGPLDYCIQPGSYRVSTDVYFGAHFSLVWTALFPVLCAGCSPAVIQWEAGGRRKTAPHQGHPPLARSEVGGGRREREEGEREGRLRGGRREMEGRRGEGRGKGR